MDNAEIRFERAKREYELAKNEYKSDKQKKRREFWRKVGKAIGYIYYYLVAVYFVWVILSASALSIRESMEITIVHSWKFSLGILGISMFIVALKEVMVREIAEKIKENKEKTN